MTARWRRKGVVIVAGLAMLAAAFFVGRSSVQSGSADSGSADNGVGRDKPQLARGGSLSRQIRTIVAAASGEGRPTVLKTERCPTQAAIKGQHLRSPSSVMVRTPLGHRSPLSVYADGAGSLLPAPAGWECTASIATDGGQQIGVGPVGSVGPGFAGIRTIKGRGRAVRAVLEASCAGCIASLICPFFPHADVIKVYKSLQPCPAKPKGELRYRLSPSTFPIVDLPRARGRLVGSGGPLPTAGAIS